MSKNVKYLKKIWNDASTDPITMPMYTTLYATIMVFAAYGAKAESAKEISANNIVETLANMIWSPSIFKSSVLSANNTIQSYFQYAIMQMLGLINLQAQTTPPTVFNASLNLTPPQRGRLHSELIRQAEEPSQEMQKYFLGVMISTCINQFTLTPGSSGFASACFVVAKELELPNISRSVWTKIINAANFSGGFLERGNSRSRRAVELALITRGRPPRPESPPPAYETLNIIRRTPLPAITSTDIPPEDLPPAFEEIDLLETIDLAPLSA